MDARLRELERRARLGDVDAQNALTAAQNRLKPKVKARRFKFWEFGINLRRRAGVYFWSRSDYIHWPSSYSSLTERGCTHAHKTKDAAKKCAIRWCKKYVTNYYSIST